MEDQQLLNVFSQVPRPQAPQGPRPAPVPGQEERLIYRVPKERFTRHFGRSDSDQHPWERAADELYRWERETPEKLAAALMPTGRAPFTTAAPATEQAAFWEQQLRLPDGTINQQALDALLTAASAAEVHALADAIRQGRSGENGKKREDAGLSGNNSPPELGY